MNETEILRYIKTVYGAMIAEASADHQHRPEVMAGIIMRETQGGLSPLLDQQGPGGRGDRDPEGRYHGHGLCQIDDRSFPEFCASEAWKDPEENISFGAKVLAGKRRYLSQAGVPESLIERAAIAAYNCGEGNVLKAWRAEKDLDSATAGKNYSKCVLEFAAAYADICAADKPAAQPEPLPEIPTAGSSGFLAFFWRFILKIFIGRKAADNGSNTAAKA
jgi:hypothetical protein